MKTIHSTTQIPPEPNQPRKTRRNASTLTVHEFEEAVGVRVNTEDYDSVVVEIFGEDGEELHSIEIIGEDTEAVIQ